MPAPRRQQRKQLLSYMLEPCMPWNVPGPGMLMQCQAGCVAPSWVGAFASTGWVHVHCIGLHLFHAGSIVMTAAALYACCRFYAPQLFQAAGQGADAALLSTVITGVRMLFRCPQLRKAAVMPVYLAL